MSWLDDVKYGPDGLVPVIAQEAGTKDVLMHAWMNREALERTVERGLATYWSRSRRQLWTKGESSGNAQAVREVRLDCDRDTILLVVEQMSAVPGEPAIACHTGRHACFFERLEEGAWRVVEPVLKDPAAIYAGDR